MGNWWYKFFCMKNEVCEKCNQMLHLVKVVDEKSAIMECKHCHERKLYSYDEKEFPSNINSFNWGAFVWWPYWGFSNGMSRLFLIYFVLSLLSFLWIPIIVLIVLSIYYGKKGNLLSWKNKHWESIERFEKIQNRWDVAGIIGFIIFLISCLYLFLDLLSA